MRTRTTTSSSSRTKNRPKCNKLKKKANTHRSRIIRNTEEESAKESTEKEERAMTTDGGDDDDGPQSSFTFGASSSARARARVKPHYARAHDRKRHDGPMGDRYHQPSPNACPYRTLQSILTPYHPHSRKPFSKAVNQRRAFTCTYAWTQCAFWLADGPVLANGFNGRRSIFPRVLHEFDMRILIISPHTGWVQH